MGFNKKDSVFILRYGYSTLPPEKYFIQMAQACLPLCPCEH